MEASAAPAATVAGADRHLDASIDDHGNLIISAAELPLEAARELKLVLRAAHPHVRRPRSATQVAVVTAAVALAAGAMTLLAMHGRQWRWTGFEGNTSLWSWLETFAQPIVLASLTIRLLTSDRGWRTWRIAGIVSGVLLAVIIVASYSWDWSWTGFRGVQLWDWLHLLLLPVVLVLLPEWMRAGEPFGQRERIIAAGVLAGFVVLIIGGYHWGWTWTGFTGNSFRDWLDLMIAPFLLPAATKIVHAYHTSGRGGSAAQLQHERVVKISAPQ